MNIKHELQEILRQIDENRISAWNGDLSETTDAVALADHDDNDHESGDEPRPVIQYNGWYERLKQLTEIL